MHKNRVILAIIGVSAAVVTLAIAQAAAPLMLIGAVMMLLAMGFFPGTLTGMSRGHRPMALVGVPLWVAAIAIFSLGFAIGHGFAVPFAV
ncbi:MAG: hypothetical protein A2991_01465 [Candidatus Terrybacteria bacterium RIFCSPLOWO2_01_FULL_58_14]|uniref:Uncharacterized protein n=2 Tax=Candidatus Terryibacteriota TaxID=1817920 RepID=A0A1G2Q021_9BACT|nr:MAG: hypothetical protein A2682_00830 [Candidatus Terrybacteria bacterium RIFCSPHIGHO2_01_FULL_58_15]OHA53936.1 MAG: hypothetical protein A2991_01465 [Candidatus Terrybacteria bacterium RIFCSPLOWO2_01_FULL_58_14]